MAAPAAIAPPGPQLGSGVYVLDGRLDGLSGMHFDIKALADVTKEVLDGIEQEIQRAHPTVALRFSPCA